MTHVLSLVSYLICGAGRIVLASEVFSKGYVLSVGCGLSRYTLWLLILSFSFLLFSVFYYFYMGTNAVFSTSFVRVWALSDHVPSVDHPHC